MDVARDVDCVGRGAESDDFGVEADGDIDVVFTWQKDKSIPVRAELTVLLDRVDLVDLGLDVGSGHRRVEDEDFIAEIGLFGVGSHCLVTAMRERAA